MNKENTENKVITFGDYITKLDKNDLFKKLLGVTVIFNLIYLVLFLVTLSGLNTEIIKVEMIKKYKYLIELADGMGKISLIIELFLLYFLIKSENKRDLSILKSVYFLAGVMLVVIQQSIFSSIVTLSMSSKGFFTNIVLVFRFIAMLVLNIAIILDSFGLFNKRTVDKVRETLTKAIEEVEAEKKAQKEEVEKKKEIAEEVKVKEVKEEKTKVSKKKTTAKKTEVKKVSKKPAKKTTVKAKKESVKKEVKDTKKKEEK